MSFHVRKKKNYEQRTGKRRKPSKKVFLQTTKLGTLTELQKLML